MVSLYKTKNCIKLGILNKLHSRSYLSFSYMDNHHQKNSIPSLKYCIALSIRLFSKAEYAAYVLDVRTDMLEDTKCHHQYKPYVFHICQPKNE